MVQNDLANTKSLIDKDNENKSKHETSYQDILAEKSQLIVL